MEEPQRQTILGIGEVLWDCFDDGRRPGGAPANVVYHASQLGHHGILASRVGDDDDGEELARLLAGRGLDLTCLQRDPARPTGRVSVDLTDASAPAFTIEEGAAWDALEVDGGLERVAGDADAVCVGTLGQRSAASRVAVRRCLELAAEALTVYDVNLRPPFFRKSWVEKTLRLVRVVKLNAEELGTLQGLLELTGVDEPALARDLGVRYGVALVCVTRGADGCLLVSREATHVEPGIPVETIDAVGAGDAFTAGLIFALLRDWDPARTARFANRLGALVASRRGAMPDLSDALPAMLREA